MSKGGIHMKDIVTELPGMRGIRKYMTRSMAGIQISSGW